VQLPSLLRLGWRFKFELGFKNEEVRQVLKLMIPRTIRPHQLAITLGAVLPNCLTLRSGLSYHLSAQRRSSNGTGLADG